MGKLGIYLLANYPSTGRFIEAVRVCARLGVDFLEVGFPFSDPVADGEILERASYETLKWYNLDDSAKSLRTAREIFPGRVYVMTYANILYSVGIETFADKVGPVTGVILADLPLREIGFFEKQLAGKGINLVRFLTPESRADDIDRALRGANDFIYFISKRGTTGGGFTLDEETVQKIALARNRGVDVLCRFRHKGSKRR